MTIATAFWIIVLIWLLFGGWFIYKDRNRLWWGIPTILLIIIGWAVFGAPIKG